MKSYEEMTESVFKRIDEYEKEKKRKTALMKKSLIPVVCICVCAIVCLGVFGLPKIKEHTLKPYSDSTDLNYSGETKIVINKTKHINKSLSDFALMFEDFITMDKDELKDYYGVDIFPDVPSDLKEKETRLGIFKRNGTDEIYHDVNNLYFTDDASGRTVSLACSKGKMPHEDTVVEGKSNKKSLINGTEVFIFIITGDISKGDYMAEFMYKNTGFRVFAHGLTEKEMIDVLSSLIES